MNKYIFEPNDRVMLKLSYRTDLLILTVLYRDDLGLWLDSYDTKEMIEATPVLGQEEKFSHDWSGHRPPLYIPFAQIEYLLKVQR